MWSRDSLLFFFSNRLSPIRTSLIADVENELSELHDEWIKMNDFLEDIYLFRKELNGIFLGWQEILSRPLILNDLSPR